LDIIVLKEDLFLSGKRNRNSPLEGKKKEDKVNTDGGNQKGGKMGCP